MATLDELKKEWQMDAPAASVLPRFDQADLLATIRARGARQVNRAIQYFWASLTLQIIIYGMLTHLFVRFWGVPAVQWLCLAGGLLYLPFTVVLMRQFKRVARASPARQDGSFSVRARMQRQYDSLRAFYRFKRGYEYGLIPLSTALGVYLTFRLYVPGGLWQHPTGAITTCLLTLLACGWSILRENRRHFERPLRDLEEVLREFEK